MFASALFLNVKFIFFLPHAVIIYTELERLKGQLVTQVIHLNINEITAFRQTKAHGSISLLTEQIRPAHRPMHSYYVPTLYKDPVIKPAPYQGNDSALAREGLLR